MPARPSTNFRVDMPFVTLWTYGTEQKDMFPFVTCLRAWVWACVHALNASLYSREMSVSGHMFVCGRRLYPRLKCNYQSQAWVLCGI
jgi:hypothetical protein